MLFQQEQHQLYLAQIDRREKRKDWTAERRGEQCGTDGRGGEGEEKGIGGGTTPVASTIGPRTPHRFVVVVVAHSSTRSISTNRGTFPTQVARLRATVTKFFRLIAIARHVSNLITFVARHGRISGRVVFATTTATSSSRSSFVTISRDVTGLATIVARTLVGILVTIFGNVTRPVTPITSVHVFFAVARKMTRTIAFVTFHIHASIVPLVASSTTPATGLRTIALHVTRTVASITHCRTHCDKTKVETKKGKWKTSTISNISYTRNQIFLDRKENTFKSCRLEETQRKIIFQKLETELNWFWGGGGRFF